MFIFSTKGNIVSITEHTIAIGISRVNPSSHERLPGYFVNMVLDGLLKEDLAKFDPPLVKGDFVSISGVGIPTAKTKDGVKNQLGLRAKTLEVIARKGAPRKPKKDTAVDTTNPWDDTTTDSTGE